MELEEAARVDGAGPLRVFGRIILPLLAPVLSTATILICLYVWNDVFYAFFVVGGRLDTLPLLVVFVVAQRKIISGTTSGAVKQAPWLWAGSLRLPARSRRNGRAHNQEVRVRRSRP